jgi:hypothetical protein
MAQRHRLPWASSLQGGVAFLFNGYELKPGLAVLRTAPGAIQSGVRNVSAIMARRSAMGTIWIFKTNYANPIYQVEFSPRSGIVPERLRFSDLHELRHFLDSHRLPGISSEQVIHQLVIHGSVEIRVAA